MISFNQRFVINVNNLTANIYSGEGNLIISQIARFAFYLYLFFVFFGTSMPFKEKIDMADNIVASNPIKQYVYSSIYLLSIFCLIPQKRQLFQIIKKEKFLTLFLLWCFISIFWADFKIVSFKRWVQLFGSVIVCLSGLLYIGSTEKVFDYLKSILIIYIPLSLFSVFFIPGAVQDSFSGWRGIAPHKNYLGQVSLVSILVWVKALYSTTLKKTIVPSIFLILSIILLLGSKSMTSLVVIVLLAGMGSIFFIDNFLIPLGIGRTFSMSVLFLLICTAITFIIIEPNISNLFFDVLGKDFSFTGRTVLWKFIVAEIKEHLLFGCGYGSFWLPQNETLDYLYQEFVWLPIQSHNGFLDIINETGLIGIILLCLLIISYFINLTKLAKPHYWKWFVISAIIINFQETSLFKPNMMIGVLFILAYLSLFVDNMRLNRSKFPKE